MSDSESQPAVFDAMRRLSSRTRKVTMADPIDIVSSDPVWSVSQKLVAEELRGHPEGGYRISTREGAALYPFEIRRLTSAEQSVVEAMMDSVMPPEIMEERPNPNRGEPPVKVRVGYDEEDPVYLASRRTRQKEQDAAVILFGVLGLDESTAGEDPQQKITRIRAELDDKLIHYLASEILRMTYSAGDAADFFTIANSAATPS
ncbi:MAG: hypothetical protein EOP85_00175 [Verrucomicrobiaceae bacterium]|nr:MAG: hypothetical protein EOP85_00175 [Verrucomicrobiaceae bacterium]